MQLPAALTNPSIRATDVATVLATGSRTARAAMLRLLGSEAAPRDGGGPAVQSAPAFSPSDAELQAILASGTVSGARLVCAMARPAIEACSQIFCTSAPASHVLFGVRWALVRGLPRLGGRRRLPISGHDAAALMSASHPIATGVLLGLGLGERRHPLLAQMERSRVDWVRHAATTWLYVRLPILMSAEH